MMAKKLLSAFLMLVLIANNLNVFGLTNELKNDLVDAVVLYTNSNMAYANNKDTYIDTSNKDVKSIVKNGITLIPLRFISENFGAKVTYDSNTKTATITVNYKNIKLKSNDNMMIIDDKSIKIDEPAQIINGRMLVPLRAFAEALGKNVFYEKGVIIISDSKKTLDSTKVNELVSKFNDASVTFLYQLSKPVKGDIIATMKTSYGDIKIKLFYKDAPLAVENFVRLSQKNYYNNVLFHRVIKDFMIQGGDPKGTGMGGESIWGKPFKNEISKKLFNIRGALAMANSGPDTNGSQFFIVQNPTISEELKDQCKSMGMEQNIIDSYSKIGGAPWLDGSYSVFGQVYEGMDVVDKIANVGTGVNDKPEKDVKILSISTSKMGFEKDAIVFTNSTAKDTSTKPKAADFELVNVDGKKVKLSDFKGKTVVLNFWATWCGPCKNEMPDVNKVAGELAKTKDSILLAINLGEDKATAVKFMKDNGYKMNLLLDTDNSVAKKYGITGIPTTVVIDKDGNISGKIVGSTTYERIMKLVNGN